MVKRVAGVIPSQQSSKKKLHQYDPKEENYDGVDINNLPPLLQAVYCNDIGKVGRLISASQDKYLNERDEYKRTALHYAAFFDYYGTLSLLLESSASLSLLEAKDDAGKSPLFKAVEASSMRCLKLLISFGCETMTYENSGTTPLHVAVLSNNTLLIDILLNGDADVDIKDQLGFTPLHLACGLGYAKVTKHLLLNDANPNEKDKKGRTPIFGAASACAVEITDLLIKYGADPTIVDDNGRLPVSVSTSKKKNDFNKRKFQKRGSLPNVLFKSLSTSQNFKPLPVISSKSKRKSRENISVLTDQMEQIENRQQKFIVQSNFSLKSKISDTEQADDNEQSQKQEYSKVSENFAVKTSTSGYSSMADDGSNLDKPYIGPYGLDTSERDDSVINCPISESSTTRNENSFPVDHVDAPLNDKYLTPCVKKGGQSLELSMVAVEDMLNESYLVTPSFSSDDEDDTKETVKAFGRKSGNVNDSMVFDMTVGFQVEDGNAVLKVLGFEEKRYDYLTYKNRELLAQKLKRCDVLQEEMNELISKLSHLNGNDGIAENKALLLLREDNVALQQECTSLRKKNAQLNEEIAKYKHLNLKREVIKCNCNTDTTDGFPPESTSMQCETESEKHDIKCLYETIDALLLENLDIKKEIKNLKQLNETSNTKENPSNLAETRHDVETLTREYEEEQNENLSLEGEDYLLGKQNEEPSQRISKSQRKQKRRKKYNAPTPPGPLERPLPPEGLPVPERSTPQVNSPMKSGNNTFANAETASIGTLSMDSSRSRKVGGR